MKEDTREEHQSSDAGEDNVVALWAQSWVEYFQRDATRVNTEVRQLRERLRHAAALEEN